MTILLVSDLHYTLPQLDWVLGAAPRHDLVVIAGDLLDVSSSVPLDAQIVVVTRWLAELRSVVPVAFGSGNHDLTGRDQNGEKAAVWLPRAAEAGVVVDGGSLTIDGREGSLAIHVTVCPWWDGPEGRAAVEAQFERDAAVIRAAEGSCRWIWVYHWPPDGSPTCWTGTKHYGDADLLAWIDRHAPDVVLTGHVHDPPFKPAGSWADRVGSTWVFNAGRQIGPVPTHVVMDLDGGVAEWRSLMGDEQRSLEEEQPLQEERRLQ